MNSSYSMPQSSNHDVETTSSSPSEPILLPNHKPVISQFSSWNQAFQAAASILPHDLGDDYNDTVSKDNGNDGVEGKNGSSCNNSSSGSNVSSLSQIALECINSNNNDKNAVADNSTRKNKKRSREEENHNHDDNSDDLITKLPKKKKKKKKDKKKDKRKDQEDTNEDRDTKSEERSSSIPKTDYGDSQEGMFCLNVCCLYFCTTHVSKPNYIFTIISLRSNYTAIST